MIHSRYDLLPGIKQRVHIGHGHAELSVRSHISSGNTLSSLRPSGGLSPFRPKK